ncbi:hypothetical protein JOC86_001731 [Bacillus pakistanensis]|uniref:Uncharacterized protein n=1 Tax=Rossellomorea pakistanensis TaxID=992288 RepID=A0ABS2NBJ8_9BACI|nr:ABC transporter permease [Bacillus pakistanensis]MBM7585189.1 hypothetical protein [Bacillus pakistanensis]
MIRLFRAEWYKVRKSKILPVLLLGPLIAGISGAGKSVYEEGNQWLGPLFMMIIVHAQIFLPLLTGVLVAFICRYEHQNGGWKQLFALPVTRGQVFTVKFAIVAILIAVVQLLFLLGLYIIGMMKGFNDPFPLLIWKSILGGWIACLPLIALQLWVSLAWSSFAAPLALNVIFTLPNILVANSATYGPWYPWAQPLLTMIAPLTQGDVANNLNFPIETLVFVISTSFLVFAFSGFIYFQRKTV